MNLTQATLDIAMQMVPFWMGQCSNNEGSKNLIDTKLPRAEEHFTGGTLWVLGSTLSLHEVESHEEQYLTLATAPTFTGTAGSPQILNYAVSGIPFGTFLQVINSVLQGRLEMTYEDITIDTGAPRFYELASARDIRRVEVIPTDTDEEPYRHHYWREGTQGLELYYSSPTTEGTLRLHYPQRIPLKTAANDELPDRIMYPAFINHCMQAILRLSIAKMGQDKAMNYDLMNDAKDKLERSASHENWAANLLLPHDTRYFA